MKFWNVDSQIAVGNSLFGKIIEQEKIAVAVYFKSRGLVLKENLRAQLYMVSASELYSIAYNSGILSQGLSSLTPSFPLRHDMKTALE